MNARVWVALVGVTFAVAGCGSDKAAQKTSAPACRTNCAAPTDAGEQSPSPKDAGDGWTTFIEGKWQIDPGTETYRCVRVTLDHDFTVNKFRSLSPKGTHHTVLTVESDPTEPDGMTECAASTNGPSAVFGSGVGTNDYELPPGIAMEFHEGQQLLLNLHLFNTGIAPIEGTSGTLVQTIPKDQVEHVAEGVLSGTVDLDIPPGQPVVQSGNCTMDHDVTIIVVFPHMHRLGTHLKTTAESPTDGTVVLHDADYSFDSQLIYPVTPLTMKKGDVVKTDCTYMNTGSDTVHFGQSTTDEMCFTGLFRYPVGENPSFACLN